MCVSIISDQICYFIDTYFQTLTSEALKYHKKAIKLTNFMAIIISIFFWSMSLFFPESSRVQLHN